MLRIALASFLFASPAIAATHAFEATLAAAPAEARLISSELIWTCAGVTCAARGAMTDTPARMCARLARDRGRLVSFVMNGVGFDVDRLASCNARAR